LIEEDVIGTGISAKEGRKSWGPLLLRAIRSVQAYHDPGPKDIPGLRLENMSVVEEGILESLRARRITKNGTRQ